MGSVGFRNTKSFSCDALRHSIHFSLACTHKRTNLHDFCHTFAQMFEAYTELVKSTPTFIFCMLFVKWLQTYVNTHTPSPPPRHLHTMLMRLQLNNNINNILCLFVVTAVATVSVHLLLFIYKHIEHEHTAYPFWFDMLRFCLMPHHFECIWSDFAYSEILGRFFATLINDEHCRHSFRVYHLRGCQSTDMLSNVVSFILQNIREFCLGFKCSTPEVTSDIMF